MAAPPFTNLDFQQAIRGAYDEAEGRFRVETAATIINGAVEVAIDASTDNIQIRDPNTGNNLKINVDGSINVSGISSITITGTVTTDQAGLDSYKTTQYTVGTSEIQLAPTSLVGRSSVSFKVHTAESTDFVLFAQAPGQAATNGYRLDDGESMQMDLTASGNIYVIGSSVGQKIYLLEIA